ncbi:alpha-amylase family glycosyl hydrolase [soil metagenome]
MAAPWWQTAVIYQIYPRSFADADGDGIGDLEGIRRRLDHLVWLGVDAIWLSPFFRSPMADFGYDVSDYCDVDPTFGTLDDFDRLLADAHERGIKLVIDWVPNHSSDQHPWFVESRSGPDSPKRDWYVWRDPAPDGGPPNNWVAAFTDRPAWTLDATSGQYYLHLFLPEQPDLNWRHPEVVDAMHGVLRFWLDRGVDGFRADVVHAIGKDPALPDNPPNVAALPHSGLNDHPFTHELLRDLRRLLDGYPGDRMMVGEVYLLSTALVAKYYGDGDELHLSFNFPPLYTPWDAAKWRHRIARVAEELEPIDAWPTWVLSNHDNPRHRTRYGSDARARAAAVLLCTLRGTPFLYQGEELGLEDAVVPADRVVDPGGRDGCRAPIPWDAGPGLGWAGAEPWLPWPPHAADLHAEAQRADPASMARLYRRLLAARRASPALHLGATTTLDTADGLLGYERSLDGDRRLVLVNFAPVPSSHPVAGWTVEVASDGAGEGTPFGGTVSPEQAVVLRPG